MKIKTSELSGAALDWAVLFARNPGVANLFSVTHCLPAPFSTDWALAGPIIEEEKINLWTEGYAAWEATQPGVWQEWGSTPLIAAMRRYVGSKLGNEVKVPDELTQGEEA